ncbi:MAG: helix-turn-helix transcriptional regulator [Bdellovibrionaceae bacterium]|nr:helix-turn-helix transcriptional regulator [Pseudobdellovibrionaceae bacterium]
MRDRKLSYRELATLLNTSLPTFKRWMTRKDFSFMRLEQICSALGIEVEELIVSALKAPGGFHSFNHEQELFFRATSVESRLLL